MSSSAGREVLREVLSLLLPVRCAGCGADGYMLCGPCRARLVAEPHWRTLSGGLRVTSGCERDELTAAIMLAYKQEGRVALARPLGAALRRAVAAARPPRERVAIVAVPSSRAAFRRRGFRPVDELLRAAGLPVCALLRLRAGVADQRFLSRADRETNVAGAFRVTGPLPVGATSALLVDDVVTTGATLRHAQRALEAEGIRVCAAATVLSTPRRNAPENDR